jgi:TonB family protein
VSSPIYSQSGAGRIGSNLDTTLGTRFPAYAARVQEITRQNWRTQDVDRSVSVAPPVTIRFDIMKDGHVESARLIRRSGISSLDDSVRSAIETAHYPSLPDGYDKNSVSVEFTFELKR